MSTKRDPVLGTHSDTGRLSHPARTAESEARMVADRYLHEVVTGAGPAVPEDVIANEVLRQRTAALRTAFPDLSLAVDHLFANDYFAAVHATASATHRGTFHGVPPTGRRWRASYTAILRITDGRITDFWDNWDMLSILEQLGAVRRTPAVSA